MPKRTPKEKKSEQLFYFVEAKTRRSNFVREWRTHRGFTQEELAEAIAYSGSAVSQLENEKAAYTQTFLEAISIALKCHPADLIWSPPYEETVDAKITRALKEVPDDRKEQLLNIILTFTDPAWKK
jgi:transcriptional regulator with XRE-family HTH domain